MAFNWSRAVQGGLAGAGTGAAAGSAFPIIGNTAGLIGGGILGALSGGFGGGDEINPQASSGQMRRGGAMNAMQDMSQVPGQEEGDWWNGYPGYQSNLALYSPQQQAVQNQQLQQGQQNTNIDAIINQARADYQKNIQPSIAHRFASHNGLSGSGFNYAMRQSGSDLERQLAVLRHQAGQQQLDRGLTRQFEPQYNKEREGVGQSLASTLLPLGVKALTYAPELYEAYKKWKGTQNVLGGSGAKGA